MIAATARPTLPLLGLLLLSACASREDRIASALMDYGFPRQPARCVARELDDQLSDRQIRAIDSAVSSARRAAGSDKPAELAGRAIDALREAGDPQVIEVTLRAGLACSLLG